MSLPANLKQFAQIIVEKDQLDVFSNPNLEALLDELGNGRDIVLYGVVTEICVAFTARGLLKRGFRVTCVTDAVRALDDAKAREFFADITRAGAQLCTTAERLAELDRE
jgi:nicotinamidase-related amidase